MTVRGLTLAGLLTLAGCGGGQSGSANQSVPTSYTGPTTRRFPSARTGELIRCHNRGISVGAHVPAPGHSTGAVADGKAASATLQLIRKADGSLVVSCQT